MDTDLSLIEISGEDDSLLPLENPSDTIFPFSPLGIARSKPPATPSAPPSIGSKKIVKFEERVDDRSGEEGSGVKADGMNLNVDPMQMKKKKKAGGYSLRKSLAWNKAFLTEEGVLDSEELSIVTGAFSASSREPLSVIQEEGKKSATGNKARLQSPKEKMFAKSPQDKIFTKSSKEKMSGKSPQEKIIAASSKRKMFAKSPGYGFGSSPKHNPLNESRVSPGQEISSAHVRRLVLSAQDAIRRDEKHNGCPRPSATSYKRPATVNISRAKEPKLTKVSGPKVDCCPHPMVTKSSLPSTSHSSRNYGAEAKQGVRFTRSVAVKSSLNDRGATRIAKPGNSLKPISSKESAKPERNKSKLPPKAPTSSYPQVPKFNNAKNIKDEISEQLLHKDGGSQKNHYDPVPQKPSPSDDKKKVMHVQMAKPTGLRMPTPSLGFFCQPKLSSSLGDAHLQNTPESTTSSSHASMRIPACLQRPPQVPGKISGTSKCLLESGEIRSSKSNVRDFVCTADKVESKVSHTLDCLAVVQVDVLVSESVSKQGKQPADSNAFTQDEVMEPLKTNGRTVNSKSSNREQVRSSKDQEKSGNTRREEVKDSFPDLKSSYCEHLQSSEDQENSEHALSEDMKDSDLNSVLEQETRKHDSSEAQQETSNVKLVGQNNCGVASLDELAAVDVKEHGSSSFTEKQSSCVIRQLTECRMTFDRKFSNELEHRHLVIPKGGILPENLKNDSFEEVGIAHSGLLLNEEAVSFAPDNQVASEHFPIQVTRFCEAKTEGSETSISPNRYAPNVLCVNADHQSDYSCGKVAHAKSGADSSICSDMDISSSHLESVTLHVDEDIEILHTYESIADKESGYCKQVNISEDQEKEGNNCGEETKDNLILENVSVPDLKSSYREPLESGDDQVKAKRACSKERQDGDQHFVLGPETRERESSEAQQTTCDAASPDEFTAVDVNKRSCPTFQEEQSSCEISESAEWRMSFDRNLGNVLDHRHLIIPEGGISHENLKNVSVKEFGNGDIYSMLNEETVLFAQDNQVMSEHGSVQATGFCETKIVQLLEGSETRNIQNCCDYDVLCLDADHDSDYSCGKAAYANKAEDDSTGNDMDSLSSHLKSLEQANTAGKADTSTQKTHTKMAESQSSEKLLQTETLYKDIIEDQHGIGDLGVQAVCCQEESSHQCTSLDDQRDANMGILENSSCENATITNDQVEQKLHVTSSNTEESDADIPRGTQKHGSNWKPKGLVIKPPPNAVPFSEEWLAAIEAAGEDILTLKSGAVQNSPPDKPMPEPSPWSPVKRFKNQEIGPFDCTKHINVLPPP